MELWREVWREGFAPQLSTRQLTELRDRIKEQPDRFIAGRTFLPHPVHHDRPCAACVLGWLAWGGDPEMSIAEGMTNYRDLLVWAQQRLTVAGIKPFFAWFDGPGPLAPRLVEIARECDDEINRRVAA